MFSAVKLININLSFAPQTTSKSQYSFAHLIFKMIKIAGFFFCATATYKAICLFIETGRVQKEKVHV